MPFRGVSGVPLPLLVLLSEAEGGPWGRLPCASGLGGILFPQDEECPGWTPSAGLPLCRLMRGCLLPGGEGEALPGWVPGGGGCSGCFLPLAGSAGMARASGWDSPHLPCATGMSLLTLPSVSRLGVRKYQAWVTFAGWEVGRHPVAVLFPSGVVFHLPQFSVGSPVSYARVCGCAQWRGAGRDWSMPSCPDQRAPSGALQDPPLSLGFTRVTGRFFGLSISFFFF